VPIIERRLLHDRTEKKQKGSSRVLILATILIAVLMLGATAGLMVHIVNNKEQPPSETPLRTPAAIAYSTHDPISINGNGGFIPDNGVVGGSGTASDPYIIADWDINASTASGISIAHTSVYFIIRDCYIHNGDTNYIAGIYLNVCANGTLSNNSCSNNVFGIEIAFSKNITICNNSCSSNY
jgi:parallel beta-helix repeat protein